MITRRQLLHGGVSAGAATLIGTSLAGCSRPTGSERDPEVVRFWGVGGAQREAQDQIIAEFNELHPEITVVTSTVPKVGDGDATSIVTAVRGGTAPDLWYMDRFTGAQYAAVGLLEPITPLIERYEDDPEFLDQWLPFARDELTYAGQVYGLPMGTGIRLMYVNRQVMRDAGLDPDELDPEQNDPITVDRLAELNEAIVERDSRGSYTRLGLIPWDAQGWGFTWCVANEARYFDPASCQVTMDSPRILQAYQYLYDQAREMDYPRVDAFKATYEPPNHPPAQTAFLSGNQAFQINETTTAQVIRKYAPDLDVGYANLPVFRAGRGRHTWAGGFSVVAPKGSSMSRAAWEFMKFFCGRQGQQVFAPATGSLPTQTEVIASDDPAIRSLGFFLDQLSFATSRPPLPVSQIWWTSMIEAQDSVVLGSRTPEQALHDVQDALASRMQTYCPFELPAGYGTVG